MIASACACAATWVACGGREVEDSLAVTTPLSHGGVGAGNIECGDPVLNDQITTGGLRVTMWQPCFDIADEMAPSQRDRVAAEHQRELQARAAADSIAGAPATGSPAVSAARVACAAVPIRERSHSPFVHKRSIERVEPIRMNGQLAGVRVVFKRVRGLNAEWLRRDIACQQARFAATGADIDPAWAATDPTLVEGATVNVVDRAGHVEVIVTAPTSQQAEVVIARAGGHVGPQNAAR